MLARARTTRRNPRFSLTFPIVDESLVTNKEIERMTVGADRFVGLFGALIAAAPLAASVAAAQEAPLIGAAGAGDENMIMITPRRLDINSDW